jgi:L-fucose isomerase-like protein
MSRPTLGVLSIGVPYFDVETANRHLTVARELLESSYGVVGPQDMVTDRGDLEETLQAFREARIDALLLQIGTFPDGELAAMVADDVKVPVVVHSLPEPRLDEEVSLNSLCGASMTAFTLRALDTPYLWSHGDLADPANRESFLSKIQACVALSLLRGEHIGLIGFRAPGFYPCAFDEILLRRTFGLGIDHIGLSALASEWEKGERRQAPRDRFPMIGGGVLPDEAVERMERFYAAITNVIQASGHRVVAIKDWPEFFDAETTGGFWPALGWIQDDGIVLAPEGDVNAAVTMALQHNLADGIPTLVDVAAWDDDASTLTLWHYGGAESLAAQPEQIRYGRFGREVAYTFKPGAATLARIGMDHGRLRLLTVEVEILDQRIDLRRAAGLARTVRTPAGQVIERVIDEGWEHHPCLAYGSLSDQFASIARLVDIPHTAL